MRFLKFLCKNNKEVTNDLCDELGVEREQLFKLLNQEELRRMVREAIEKEAKNFLGRRSFLEALALGAGITIGSMGLAKGEVLISNDNVIVKDPSTGLDWDLRTPLPFSAIVGIEGKKVRSYNWRGRLIDSGVAGQDDARVIQALDGVADILTVKILSDVVLNNTTYFTKSKYVCLDFTGHTVLNNAGGDYASGISYKVNDGVFIVKNVTMDNQDKVGDGITAGATSIYPRKVILENVEVKNFTNHAFYFRLADPSTGVDENIEHDIILRNVKGVATSDGSLNECLTVDNARKVVIENVEFIGNKIGYIIASETLIDGLKYYTSNWGFTVRSRYVIYNNIIADGSGSNAHLVIEPYVSMELAYQFDSCYFAEVRGFRGIGNACRIKLRPYDDTYVLKHVVIDGITQQQTPIHIETPTNYATIETLEVRNVKFLSYSLLYQILYDLNVSIKNLVIDSVELPGINATYTRIIYIKNDKANREINAVIKAVTKGIPYVGQSDDGGAGFGVTGEIDIDPILYDNFWQLTSGTSTPKLRRNSGIVTITGDGTTTTFTKNITHGLVTDDPTKIAVTITPSKACDVDYDFVDTDGDGFAETLRITLTFGTAPANGEVVYISWRAEVVS